MLGFPMENVRLPDEPETAELTETGTRSVGKDVMTEKKGEGRPE